MTGLAEYPNLDSLKAAYEKLMHTSGAVAPGDVALWSQWARLDPRLAEILTAFLKDHWRGLSPVPLNEELRHCPWPMALGPLVEQVTDTLPAPEKKLFKNWCRCVLDSVPPAPGEQYFVGQRSFAGKLMWNDAFLALKSFRKWGYLASDRLINKAARSGQQTLIPSETRRAALRELLRQKSRITVNDYLAFLENKVSRRQAELDLKSVKTLKPLGRTRGRFYRQ